MNLARSRIAFGVPHAGRNDDRLPLSGDAFRAVEGEVRFARSDDEPLLLVRVNMLGDDAAASVPSSPIIPSAPYRASARPTAAEGGRGSRGRHGGARPESGRAPGPAPGRPGLGPAGPGAPVAAGAAADHGPDRLRLRLPAGCLARNRRSPAAIACTAGLRGGQHRRPYPPHTWWPRHRGSEPCSLLDLAGVPGSSAFVATLAYRLFAYWLPVLAGGPAYLVFRHRYVAAIVSTSGRQVVHSGCPAGPRIGSALAGRFMVAARR
jgi:hypothetical protein